MKNSEIRKLKKRYPDVDLLSTCMKAAIEQASELGREEPIHFLSRIMGWPDKEVHDAILEARRRTPAVCDECGGTDVDMKITINCNDCCAPVTVTWRRS